MKKFSLGEQIRIQERCPEGKQNKGIIFNVIDYPYHSSRDGDDYVTIENKELNIYYKAFLTSYLTSVNL